MKLDIAHQVTLDALNGFITFLKSGHKIFNYVSLL